MSKLDRLRGLGPLGSGAATLITLLTTNWVVAMSAAAGIAAAALAWLREVALSPATQAGVGVFLAVPWTTIGITVLIDRRRPRVIQSHTDYRWGLTYDGFQSRYVRASDPSPEPGSL